MRRTTTTSKKKRQQVFVDDPYTKRFQQAGFLMMLRGAKKRSEAKRKAALKAKQGFVA